MSSVRETAQKLSGFTGSLAIGAFGFSMMTVLNKFHPFRFLQADIIAGVVFAIIAVLAVQILARTHRPLQSYMLCALGSLVLFLVTCSSAVFFNFDGRYDPLVALVIWGGITLGAFVWVIYWEATEQRGVHD